MANHDHDSLKTLVENGDRIIKTIIFLETERRLGKTRHGSTLGLAWNVTCAIVKVLKNLTSKKLAEKEEKT